MRYPFRIQLSILTSHYERFYDINEMIFMNFILIMLKIYHSITKFASTSAQWANKVSQSTM